LVQSFSQVLYTAAGRYTLKKLMACEEVDFVFEMFVNWLVLLDVIL
jgi:hypothetical protein